MSSWNYIRREIASLTVMLCSVPPQHDNDNNMSCFVPATAWRQQHVMFCSRHSMTTTTCHACFVPATAWQRQQHTTLMMSVLYRPIISDSNKTKSGSDFAWITEHQPTMPRNRTYRDHRNNPLTEGKHLHFILLIYSLMGFLICSSQILPSRGSGGEAS